MKKIITFLFALICLTLSGCTNEQIDNTSTTYEVPHMYWKTIQVEVQDVDYRYYYASGGHHRADVTVYSSEYGLTETFHFVGRDAVDCKNLREGDEIGATLNSWVLDRTGEVQRREIGSIDP